MPAPLLVGALAGLAAVATHLVTKVLVGLGVGAVTYAGISALIGQVEAFAIARMGELSADMVALMGVLNVDRALSMMFSAVVIRATLAGLNAAGSFRRATWSPPVGS